MAKLYKKIFKNKLLPFQYSFFKQIHSNYSYLLVIVDKHNKKINNYRHKKITSKF